MITWPAATSPVQVRMGAVNVGGGPASATASLLYAASSSTPVSESVIVASGKPTVPVLATTIV